MKAIVIHSYGDTDVLKYEDIEFPTIQQEDQVLIRVHNAGVSPFDLHVRDGPLVVKPNSQQLSELAKLLRENTITVHIEKVFPITEVAHAHHLVETGHVTGKVLLEV